jgi:hypothetical protein
MPNIEIISVRFNLNKDEDRRLFEVLQKRSDPGKRNEFIKQVLLRYLAGDSVGGKSVARPSKRQSKERDGPPDEIRQPEVSGPALTVAPGVELPPKPLVDVPSDGPASSGVASAGEPDLEAAGLVRSFVQ